LLISREDVGILATRCEDVVMLIDRSLKYTLEK
jgi:TetR/AcrR family transcriptional repressor of the ameABC operon